METGSTIHAAIQALRAGEKEQARSILMARLREHPRDEDAWLLLSGLVDTHQKKVDCLERVLRISPENKHARQRLDRLRGTEANAREAAVPGAWSRTRGASAESGDPSRSAESRPERPATTRADSGQIGRGALAWRERFASRGRIAGVGLVAGTALIVLCGCLWLASFFPGGFSQPTATPTVLAVVQQPSLTPPGTHTRTPSPTPTATSPAPPTPTETSEEVALVTRVIDGDTIEVFLNGQHILLRYIGVDAPEGGEPFALEATEANQALVEGQEVTLEKDVSETDSFDRLLRYVYLEDGTFVNAELVSLGLATAIAYPPDTQHQGYLEELQQEAQDSGRGLWGAPLATGTATATPPPSPLPDPTSTPGESANCDPAYPTVCIPPPPPDLDCGDIVHRRFTVNPPDPHRFDGDHDGIGCESG